MSFPFMDLTPATETQPLWESPKEFEWDCNTQEFVIRDGQIAVIEGLPALKIWLYKCLLTKRGRYDAYSWDFGTDLESLIGSGYSRAAILSETRRMVREAVLVNKHILSIANLTVTFGAKDNKGLVVYGDNTLVISFTAETDCGDIVIEI